MLKCKNCKTKGDHIYAKFCWKCGQPYNGVTTYESAMSIAQPRPARLSTPRYDISARMIASWGFVSTGVMYFTTLAAGISPIWSAAPTMVLALIAFVPVPILALQDFRAGRPDRTENITGPNKVIRVEHVTPGIDGPRIHANEAPEGLTVGDLRAVAYHVAAGHTFSSDPKQLKKMRLSQPKYYALRSWFLESGYAERKNQSRTSGIRFTHKGKMLLISTLKNKGV